jgi:squalene-hopene/tetraprenyl-beta-curcumene cyclase
MILMKTALALLFPLFPLLPMVFGALPGPLVAPRTSAQVPGQPKAPAPIALDLEDDIDDSVRWLRFVQEKEDGSYAKSVEATALVLRAMIGSPRHYQRKDGPFVQRAIDYLVSRQDKDGSIHDAGPDPMMDKPAIAKQTRMAAAALALHAQSSTEATLKRALEFIGKNEPDATPWNDAKLPEPKEALLAFAKNLLAKRNADKSWDGPDGKVRATAENVITLSRAYPILKPPSAPKPSSVKPLPTFEPADRAKAKDAIVRGASWLAAQGDKGKYGAPGSPNAGMTAMAIGGLLSAPEPRVKPVQDAIDQGIAWLVSLQKPDGSIHDGQVANYTTSAAILALVRSGKPEYKPVIEKARNFLVALQADEGEGYSPDHPYYGGNSYGDEQRPDMSNVQMALEAMSASGLGKDDPAFKRALVFLQRCQNRSESNDVKIESDGKTIVAGNDGGGVYAPGDSKAGFVELEGGKRVPRSYGSMTYALLKGYIFAGLPKDDPRMKATWEWLRKNYTLDVNPGFEALAEPTAGYQGLFYYFHTMAKALDLYGEETIVDAQGKPHSWRKDLAGRIVAMQRKEDGAWINENSPRWYEGNRVLATSYALMTLQMCAR